MSSKDVSMLGLGSGMAKVSSIPGGRTGVAHAGLFDVSLAPPEASPEALKICYRLLASMSEMDGTILVAGMGAEDATSRLAVQLACGLSQVQPEKVVLVDAERGGGSLPEMFGVVPKPGLGELLSQSAILADAVRQITPKLFFLPAGAPGLEASQFASPAFADLIERQLRRDFRYVIISSAPFGERTDVHLLAPHSDGLVLAVYAGQRRRDELVELKNELRATRTKILGVVLVEPGLPGD